NDMCSGEYGWKTAPCESKKFSQPRRTEFHQTWLEYREDALPWDSGQLTAILQLIEALSNEASPLLVVAYIHGWTHNADPGDPSRAGSNNVAKFKEVLARHHDAVRREFEMRGQNPPTVLGIYIGWAGDAPPERPCRVAPFAHWMGGLYGW